MPKHDPVNVEHHEKSTWEAAADAVALYEVLPPEQLPSGPLIDVADREEYETLLSWGGCERSM
jgi:hypothetical protein